MDRITGTNVVDIGSGRRGFRSKDTVGGVPGTVVRAGWLNDMQENPAQMIEACGLALAAGDHTLLRRAVRSQRLNFVAAANVGGTANAIALAFSPAFAAAADLEGVPLRFVVLRRG